MKVVSNDTGYPTLREKGEINVHSTIVESVRLVNPQLWQVFFKNLRFDLQNRISGLSDDDLIKLQGKLDYQAELENFFLSMVK